MVLCSDVLLLGRDEVITSKLRGNGKPSTPVSQLYSPEARSAPSMPKDWDFVNQ